MNTHLSLSLSPRDYHVLYCIVLFVHCLYTVYSLLDWMGSTPEYFQGIFPVGNSILALERILRFTANSYSYRLPGQCYGVK